MNKAKLIQTLSNLPEEWINDAYIIRISEEYLKLQMYYNSDLVKELMDGNRWNFGITANGFMEFRRNDGLEITMT